MPAKRALTERQAQLLAFDRDYYKRKGVPPLLRHISKSLGISATSAWRHQNQLWLKGYLRREGHWYVPVDETDGSHPPR